MDPRRRERYEITGWLLFGASGIAFLVDAVADGDVAVAIASALFVAGVVVFLVPYAVGRGSATRDRED